VTGDSKGLKLWWKGEGSRVRFREAVAAVSRMHAHAYACSRLIGCEALMHKCQIKTNYNADHLKKSIMQKMARFVMSTPSGKLLG
jgi:hypothetical protein